MAGMTIRACGCVVDSKGRHLWFCEAGRRYNHASPLYTNETDSTRNEDIAGYRANVQIEQAAAGCDGHVGTAKE